MSSNVRLRSNVYIRADRDIRDDEAFRAQVRGKRALEKLLRRIQIYASPDYEEQWLSPLQLKELREANLCSRCKTVVWGPVRRGNVVTMQFRCPYPVCPK